MFGDIKLVGSAKYRLIDDKTGTILREGKTKNFITRWGRQDFFNTGTAGSRTPLGKFTYISDDPHEPGELHPEYDNTIRYDQGSPASWQNSGEATSGLNQSTWTRTITHTYTAPSSPRTIRWCGMLTADGNASPLVKEGSYVSVFSALAIDPEIIQNPGETFVLQYVIVAIPPTRKEFMKRFGLNYRAALVWFDAWIQQRSSSTASNSLSYSTFINPFTVPPRDWFLDPDAIYSLGANDYFRYYRDNASSYYQNVGSGRIVHSWGSEGARVGYFNENPALDAADATKNGTWVGAIGMVGSGPNDTYTPGEDVASHNQGRPSEEVAWHMPGHWFLAQEEGEISSVFSHQVGVNYMFNEAGLEATGLGSVEARGPYRPPLDIGAPTHWMTQLVVADSGDTDPATEASYVIRRKAFFNKANLPTINLSVDPDAGLSHGGADRFVQHGFYNDAETAISTPGSSDDVEIAGTTQNFAGESRGFYNTVWDGRDSFWGIQFRVAAWYDIDQNWGLSKIRVHTPEAALNHCLSDDRRFIVKNTGQTIGQGAQQAYGLASDEDGRVFFSHRNNDESIAGNKIHIIDVRKQARWVQRPSGSSDGVDTDRFTVGTDDEFHQMYPFVAQDATDALAIRIVNSAVGNNGVYIVGNFVDAYNVDLFNQDGVTPAVLAEEEDITWHWCVVSHTPTDHGVGDLLQIHFDKINGRLWALGTLGVQYTDDYGVTWSTLFNENTVGGEVPPNDQHRANWWLGSIDYDSQAVEVDPSGALYWISGDGTAANTYLNKLEVNDGIGVNQTYSRLQLTADFPTAGTKPAYIQTLRWEKGVDNPIAIEDVTAPGGLRPMGAMWICHNDGGNPRDFYRMILKPGPLDAANITAFNSAALPIFGGTANPGHALCSPATFDGDTILGEVADLANLTSAWIYSPNTGLFYEVTNGYQRLGYTRTMVRPGDGLLMRMVESGSYQFTSAIGTFTYSYRYLLGDDDWIPFSGNSTQFDATYNAARGIIDCDSAGTGVLPTDGQTLVFDDGVNPARTYEFDTVPDGITGDVAIDISAAADDDDVRDAIIAAINGDASLDITAYIGGPGIVWLVNDTPGTAGNVAITGTAITGNFTVSGMSGGNAADGGKKLAHAAWEKTLDGVEVRWLETGDLTPTNEFIKGESYSYAAVYGRVRTNIQDWDENRFFPVAPAENLIETEDVKTAQWPPYDIYHTQASNPATLGFSAAAGSGLLETPDGLPFGSIPMRETTWFGQGDTFDSGPYVTNDDRGHWRTTIDTATAAEGTIDCNNAGTGVVVLDTETFTLNDGLNPVQEFEFDTNAALVGSGIAVNISAATTDDDVRDAIIAAVNGSSLFIRAYIGGPGIVFLRSQGRARGTGANNAIGGGANPVASGAFVTSGMSGALDPPTISKIRLLVHTFERTGNSSENNATRYAFNDGTNDQRLSNLLLAWADNLISSPAELDASLRWPGPEDTDPDAGATNWMYIHRLNSYLHQEGANIQGKDGSWQITIDLEAAGFTPAERTHRVWQILSNRRYNTTTNNTGRTRVSSFQLLDANDNIIGFTDDHRLSRNIDDFDFLASIVDEAFWIELDQSDLTTISTTDDGDGDGVTDLVTLDAGTFDPTLIDTTRDYLAWEEVGNPAVAGYLRAGKASEDSPIPSLRAQSMARIIGIEGGNTQLRLDADLVPDNLSAVNWEIRRPVDPLQGFGSGPQETEPDQLLYESQTGYIKHTAANCALKRRYRVTRYGASKTVR